MGKNVYYIYMHKNKINGKVYIGQTCQIPSNRWRNGVGYIGNDYFCKAIKKYGWDNFEHIILKDSLTLDEANIMEEFYIQKYHCLDRKYGYNIKHGGSNGLHSEKTKIKISLGNKGKIISPEQREQQSKKMKGRYKGENSPNWGKHPSLETRKKQSMARLGKKLSEKTKLKVGEHSREMVKNGTHPTAGKHGKDNPNYGKRFFNNGIKNVFCLDCPEGFVPGILYKNGPYGKKTKWYTNGLVNIRANECPDGFYLGLTKNNNFAKGV